MELLLSSNGLTNDSIHEVFRGMFNNVPAHPKITYIPSAAYAEPGPKDWVTRHIQELTTSGYDVTVTDLRHSSKHQVRDSLQRADGLYVDGGNILYLSYLMQRSGLFELAAEELDLLQQLKYFGISAGSMITTPSLELSSQALEFPQAFNSGHYEQLVPSGQGCARTLGLVDFLLRPHFNNPDFPLARLDIVEQADLSTASPIYLLDDQSAVHVTDGQVSVISEGDWQRLERT